jgi:hypothetical protein
MRLRADLILDQEEVGFCYFGSVNSITVQDEYSKQCPKMMPNKVNTRR